MTITEEYFIQKKLYHKQKRRTYTLMVPNYFLQLFVWIGIIVAFIYMFLARPVKNSYKKSASKLMIRKEEFKPHKVSYKNIKKQEKEMNKEIKKEKKEMKQIEEAKKEVLK